MKVVQALFFYPRGGSAQVVRYLSTALIRRGLECHIVSGSLGDHEEQTHAPTFFEDLPVSPVDYSDALQDWRDGRDPMKSEVPFHPSYEDRRNVPDRVFASVAPEIAEYLEQAWGRILREAVHYVPDFFHLHHLTPMQWAVRERFPGIPVVGHLHGTELKMIRHIVACTALAERLGVDLRSNSLEVPCRAAKADLTGEEARLVETTRWDQWRYASYWLNRMIRYASMCDQFIVLNEYDRSAATDLLEIDPDSVHIIPNGVDVERFFPNPPSIDDRRERWYRWLVDEPRGWDDSGEPGSVGYCRSDIDRWFFGESGTPQPVLLYVGRFVNMKRVPTLIRAFGIAQRRFGVTAPLVIWGGYPGEWEDEHPVTVARDEGIEGVFFVGWRGHNELPLGLNASDVMVAPSVNEPFGQVYLEAMACGLPVIATKSGGPLSFVNTTPDSLNGWLVSPDDPEALAAAMAEAIQGPDERRRRGANAAALIRKQYSWDGVARQFIDVFARAIG